MKLTSVFIRKFLYYFEIIFVVNGFSSEVIAWGRSPRKAATARVSAPVSAQHRHVIKEAIIGGVGARVFKDHPRSSTREYSRWWHHRRWSLSCNEILGEGQLNQKSQEPEDELDLRWYPLTRERANRDGGFPAKLEIPDRRRSPLDI